ATGAAVPNGGVEVPLRQACRFGVLDVDPRGRVTGFEEKPASPKPASYRANVAYASMGIYVFDYQVLKRACCEDAVRTSSHDFGKDILPRLVESNRVYAYNFTNDCELGDYWRDVGTLAAYWDAHMDLLRRPPDFNLYDKNWPIRTLPMTLPPGRFWCPGDRDQSNNFVDTLISPCCEIGGATIERSVLSPEVCVEPGAHIEDSIILHSTHVGKGARIRRAIVEKHVVIPDGVEIGYDPEEDARHYQVTPEGIVVVDQNPAFSFADHHVEYV
ncbi:MAG: sugar phosphate nucleotidyltransferase, partial [FCB group bacterium]|nr:sugar phosphate nucleotidyltransferase [FCB group bacterium]